MNISSINKKLKKTFGGKFSASKENGSIFVRGKSSDWGEIVAACQAAAKKFSTPHIVNDIVYTGEQPAPTRLPSLKDDFLDGRTPDVLVIGGGISGADMTHLGTFDIPLISNIPNIVYLAPTNKQEYLAMLDWGLEQTSHPVVIRVPSVMADAPEKIQKNYDALGTYQIVQEGSKVAVLALGGFFELGQKTVDKLSAQGINATLINPRFISHLDTAMLERLKQNHELVITLEDGELDGGFGEKIARFYGDSAMKVLTYGAKKEFTDRVPVDVLYERYRLTPKLITEDISAALNK